MLIKLVQRFCFKKKVIIGKDGFLYIRLRCPPPPLLLKFFSCFIFGSQKRKEFRKNVLIFKRCFYNNSVIVDLKGQFDINIRVKSKNGGNKISIGCIWAVVNISIYGDNNIISIGSSFATGPAGVTLEIGSDNWCHSPVEKCCVNILDATWIESMYYHTDTSGTLLDIGKNCMFSSGITIYNTDGHVIFSEKSHKILNKPKFVNIKDHVWIGKGVSILKNVSIPENSIVGMGSVVTKSVLPEIKQGIVLAGNPARIVKTGINWNVDASKGYDGYFENSREKENERTS